MNKIIKSILEKIEKEGYEAYVVGGYVRDYMLGRKSYDVDICTNALPKVLYEMFSIKPNDYGGINLKVKNYSIDITTYRMELEYCLGKPLKLEYTNNLLDDVQRRDFTINTLCMNKNGKIIDLLNGKEEINFKTIKIVGDAEKKITEDPLRILRAIRFATILDFKLDNELEKMLDKHAYLIKNVSNYKVRYELNKMFLSKNYEYGLKLMRKFQIDSYLDLKYDKVIFCPDLIAMWSQFETNKELFSKTELNNMNNIKEVVNYGKIDFYTLYKYGLYINTAAADLLNISKKTVDELYDNMPINDSKKLDISTDEIMRILNLKPSKKIKVIKDDIITEILQSKLDNSYDNIVKYISNKTREYE